MKILGAATEGETVTMNGRVIAVDDALIIRSQMGWAHSRSVEDCG